MGDRIALSSSPLATRTADLARLADEAWDVVIVGGGIVGSGALLDATSRGIKAAWNSAKPGTVRAVSGERSPMVRLRSCLTAGVPGDHEKKSSHRGLSAIGWNVPTRIFTCLLGIPMTGPSHRVEPGP